MEAGRLFFCCGGRARCENAVRESAILGENVRTLHTRARFCAKRRGRSTRERDPGWKCTDAPRQSATLPENLRTSHATARFAWECPTSGTFLLCCGGRAHFFCYGGSGSLTHVLLGIIYGRLHAFFCYEGRALFFFAAEARIVFFGLRRLGLTHSRAPRPNLRRAARVYFFAMEAGHVFFAVGAKSFFCFCCGGSGPLTHSPIRRGRRHNKKAATATKKNEFQQKGRFHLIFHYLKITPI